MLSWSFTLYIFRLVDILRILLFITLLIGFSYCHATIEYTPPIDAQISETAFASWKRELTNREVLLNQLIKDAHLPKSKASYLNRLIFEASPYLLRHAVNPINWRAWSDDVLFDAKKSNKLIFLSIGFSTSASKT